MKALLRRAAPALLLLACFRPAFTADLELDVHLDPSTRNFDALAELVASEDVTFALHRCSSCGRRRRRPGGGGARVPFHEDTRMWRIAAPRGAKLRIEYRRHAAGARCRARSPRGAERNAADGFAGRQFPPRGERMVSAAARSFTYTVRCRCPRTTRARRRNARCRERERGRATSRASSSRSRPTASISWRGPISCEKDRSRRKAKAAAAAHVFPSELDELADGYLEDTARYIALYSKQIGAYPYSGFSVVASPLPTGFGMPTLTYLGAQVLAAAVHPRDFARARGAAQLVGQRRVCGLRDGQLVRRSHDVHGRLPLQGAGLGGGCERDAPRVAARFRRDSGRRAPVALGFPLAYARRRGRRRLRQVGHGVPDAARRDRRRDRSRAHSSDSG